VGDFKKALGYGFLAGHLTLSAAFGAETEEDADNFRPYIADHLTYDDNLFRLANQVDSNRILGPGMSKWDVVNQFTAGGRIEYPISRQRLILDLRLDDNRFANNRDLDNLSTDDMATWKWKLGRELSGDVGYGYKHSLASFAYTQFFLKDMVSEQDGFFDLAYAWHPRWKLNAGARWQDNTHSNDLRAFLDRQSATGLIGLTYTTPAHNSAGLEYRYTGVYLPNRHPTPESLIDNHYRVQTFGGVLDWGVTAKTHIGGRVGYTRLENRQYTQRDFSGATWRASLDWAATAKTRVNLSGWRDLQPSQTVDASYMIVQGASLSAIWDVTPKLGLTGRVSHETLDFEGDPGLATGQFGPRRDTLWIGRVALAYRPWRKVEMGLAYQAERRDSTRRYADFDDNSVFASGKLEF
jgi:exopolysaccharide biosynthesis operon protein EpsL